MGRGRAVVKFISMLWMTIVRMCMCVAKLGRSKQLNKGQNSCFVKLQHKPSELYTLPEEINRLRFPFYDMYRNLMYIALTFQGEKLVFTVYNHDFKGQTSNWSIVTPYSFWSILWSHNFTEYLRHEIQKLLGDELCWFIDMTIWWTVLLPRYDYMTHILAKAED
jgi:hypothetical protein